MFYVCVSLDLNFIGNFVDIEIFLLVVDDKVLIVEWEKLLVVIVWWNLFLLNGFLFIEFLIVDVLNIVIDLVLIILNDDDCECVVGV